MTYKLDINHCISD